MSKLHDLTPHDLSEGLNGGNFVLVDVREAHEFSEARIQGAINLPLSDFDPAQLPVTTNDQTLVLSCAGGVRSAKAAIIAQESGIKAHYHLGGGIKAWMAAGLPVV